MSKHSLSVDFIVRADLYQLHNRLPKRERIKVTARVRAAARKAFADAMISHALDELEFRRRGQSANGKASVLARL